MCKSLILSVANGTQGRAKRAVNHMGELRWLAGWQAQWDSSDEVNEVVLLVSGDRVLQPETSKAGRG